MMINKKLSILSILVVSFLVLSAFGSSAIAQNCDEGDEPHSPKCITVTVTDTSTFTETSLKSTIPFPSITITTTVTEPAQTLYGVGPSLYWINAKSGNGTVYAEVDFMGRAPNSTIWYSIDGSARQKATLMGIGATSTYSFVSFTFTYPKTAHMGTIYINATQEFDTTFYLK